MMLHTIDSKLSLHNSAVSKGDKATIRSKLLESGVNEADQRLALQNALVIAKIARTEFPNDWYGESPGNHLTYNNVLQARSLPTSTPVPTVVH